MRAVLSITLLLPTMIMAQRIVPIEAEIDGEQPEVMDMVEFNGKLVVGGRFTGMNSQLAPGILAWDGGNGIDDLGVPMPSGYVMDIARYSNGVVFGGFCLPSNRHVFYWDGTVVTQLGSYDSGRVHCFATDGDILYAGGDFTTMDGDTVNHIAMWNGSDWSALGDGLDGTVNAMVVHDGDLYVGGNFTATVDGSQQLMHLARWDDSSFQSVDAGLNHRVTDLIDRPDGLWLAGDFSHTADSSLVLPRFASCMNGALAPLFTEVSFAQTNTPLLIDLADYGVLARVNGRSDLVFTDGEWYKDVIRGIECAQSFQGSVYVGGRMESDDPDSTLALCKLLPGVGHTELEVAGIKAFIRSDGSLFYDQEMGEPDFVPVDEGGASAIFAHGHYVVGYVGDSAFTSCFTPYAMKEDYVQGPRCTERSTAFTDRYQRTWPIDMGMLWAHAANWSDPGYTAPEVLTAWPGNGDVGNGEPSQVGTFQDSDGDGVYEPEQGELPVIRGDKAVLVAVSDQAADTLPQIYPSMFDTQLLLHGYDNGPPQLYQTLFVTYRFTNRSDRQYDSVVVAMATDPDLGNLDDDFIGSDPELDMFYVYNADSVDQDASGRKGFGPHPPAIGIVGLSAPMRSCISYGREAPGCCNDPNTTLDASRYAEGIWKDGTPQIDPTTDQPTRYAFSDYPDVQGGFHESDLITPDRRGIASFGPFFNVAPGESICFDMAFVFARDTTKDNIENTRVLQQKVIALREWYAQLGFACDAYQPVGLTVATPLGGSITLSPNPAADRVRLSRSDGRDDLVLGIHSPTGQLLRRIPWTGGSTDLTVDLRSLADGVYLIRPQGAAGRILRLVVAH